MSEPQLPPRPSPPRRPDETLRAWLAWFGLGRLVLTAVAVLVVVGGVAWLVRAAPLPTEATLPLAAPATITSPAATTVPTAAETDDAAGAGAPADVTVHVAGAVADPGVHVLPAGARVVDAVDRAGGATPTAELDGLNLAAPVVDGQRIYVPEAGEVDPASVAAGPPPVEGSVAPSGPIDVNRATAAELEGLPGVGPATAAAIVDDRERNGPFAAVDDLDRVPGIGPAKLDAIRDLVTV